MTRISRDEYGLTVAAAVARRADCTRRQVGAVIFDPEGRIVATGYNGAPAGEPGCASAGACPRGRLTYEEHPHGAAYEDGDARCIALHAEMNAVVYAGRERCKGATIYVTDVPCYLCQLVIKAAGIARTVTPEAHAVERVREIARSSRVGPPASSGDAPSASDADVLGASQRIVIPHVDGNATVIGPDGITYEHLEVPGPPHDPEADPAVEPEWLAALRRAEARRAELAKTHPGWRIP